MPDSGTGGLADLTGRTGITAADGKHDADFESDLPEALGRARRALRPCGVGG